MVKGGSMIFRSRIQVFWIAVLFMVLAISSCEELSQDLEKVTMKVPLTGIVFQPADYLDEKGNSGYYQKEIQFDLDSLMQANDVDNLEKSFVDKLELEVVQPQGQDLTFLKSVAVVIDSDEDFADATEIGRIENITPSREKASFDLNDEELSSFLRQEHFYVRIEYTRSNYADFDESTTLFLNGTLSIYME